MRVVLNGVCKGRNGQNLPETSLAYESGAVTLAAVETAQRPTVLALIASGRMAPDAGTVTLDEADDPALLRSLTAVVDAPDVSEPVADLKLTSVVQEELAFADRPSGRAAVSDFLAEAGASDYASWRLSHVPAAIRLRVLAELAASRPDVEALVLTTPDRTGGRPLDWWSVAADLAGRGYAVLVLAGAASVDDLRFTSERFEADRLAAIARAAAAAATAVAATETRAAASTPLPTPSATVVAPTEPSAPAGAVPKDNR